MAEAEARDAGLQLFDEVRAGVERSGQHAMPVPFSEVSEREDRLEPADLADWLAELPGCPGSRCGRCSSWHR